MGYSLGSPLKCKRQLDSHAMHGKEQSHGDCKRLTVGKSLDSCYLRTFLDDAPGLFIDSTLCSYLIFEDTFSKQQEL